jgi:hypothetical protein
MHASGATVLSDVMVVLLRINFTGNVLVARC